MRLNLNKFLNFLVSSLFLPCQVASTAPIKYVIDQIPTTINPRLTTDAVGQRLGALIYRSLTRINVNLSAEPDLASNWRSIQNNTVWIFSLNQDLKDHAGNWITPTLIHQCFTEYFNPKNKALVTSQFEDIRSIELISNNQLQIKLKNPDPFFPKNISLIRFFNIKSQNRPCIDPASEEDIIGSGPLKIISPLKDYKREICLDPVSKTHRSGCLRFILDETAKTFSLIGGETHAAPSSLSLGKTYWLQKKYPHRFNFIQDSGVNVSYLAFNVLDPILKNPKVRIAIAQALDIDSIIKYKLYGYCEKAHTFLHPKLSGANSPLLPKFNLKEANHQLDQLGYIKKNGIRFQLKYLVTTSKEGTELALIVRDQLRKAGIQVNLFVVDPAVFIKNINTGNFQLYSSRWVGVSDASIFKRTLGSDEPNNRIKYSNPEIDKWLHNLYQVKNETEMKPWIEKIQTKMNADLPYLPLFYWNNVLIFEKNLSDQFKNLKISPTGALEPYFRAQNQ